MYPRVHDYLDPQYKPNDKEVEHQKLVTNELKSAYNKGFDKFKEKAEEFADKFNEEFSDYGGF